ncbi:MAG: hypothetical protein RIT19_1942 [Verrucomicrobiota bacterium]
MKKASRPPMARKAARPVGSRILRHPRPRFGPEPVPQPVPGRLGRDAKAAPSSRRRRGWTSRVGRGAAAPLRFVFVRRFRGGMPRPVGTATRKTAASPRRVKRIAPVAASGIDLLRAPETVVGGFEANPPWLPPAMPVALDPTEIPQGLPPIPPMLLEGDTIDPQALPVGARSEISPHRADGGTVWLAGCDPRTLLLGWEDPGGTPDGPGSATEWRLRSQDEPDSILAAGPLPTDRRFLFLENPPRAAAHVAEIGVWSPRGDWECLSTSAPVSLPEAPGAETVPAPSRQETGIRPGFHGAYFRRILGGATVSSGLPGSSEHGPGLPAFLDEHGGVFTANPSSAMSIKTGGGLPSSSAPVLVPESTEGRGGADGFHFRVNAEVVLFGSTEPGARVTLAGRPVALRPDGSFTFRCALPDGRFELPLVAVSSRGAGHRRATLTLERGTVSQGEVGAHPIDPGLPSPDDIP